MDFEKPNYRPWSVQESDFPSAESLQKQFIFLLRYAILAPSAHNTQPWLFRVSVDGVDIFIDKHRILKESDRELRQTYESIGACITNLEVAAVYFGFSVYNQIDDSEEDENKKLVVRMRLAKNDNSTLKELNKKLFAAIPMRHSAKLAYASEQVSLEVVALFKQIAQGSGLTVTVFSNKEEIEKAAEVVSVGTKIAFADKSFCAELVEWLRPNWTDKPDGMPGFTVGMPGIVSWLAPKIMTRINTGGMQAKMIKQVVVQTPSIVVISGQNIRENWIKAGALFESMSLVAVANGFGTAAMGAPVEVEEAIKMLQMNLKIAERPLLFFRVGEVNGASLLAPRREIERCILK